MLPTFQIRRQRHQFRVGLPLDNPSAERHAGCGDLPQGGYRPVNLHQLVFGECDSCVSWSARTAG